VVQKKKTAVAGKASKKPVPKTAAPVKSAPPAKGKKSAPAKAAPTKPLVKKTAAGKGGAKLTDKTKTTKSATPVVKAKPVPKPAPKAAAKPAAKPAPKPAPKPAAKPVPAKGKVAPAKAAPAKAAVVAKPVAKPAPKPAAKPVLVAKPAAPAKAAPVVASKPVVAAKPAAVAPKPAVAPVSAKVAAAPAKPVAPSAAAAAAAAAKAIPDKRRILAQKNKMLPREFLLKLAEAIRAVVLPMVLEVKGREIVGSALSGDATFEIDKVAERALLQHLKSARAPVAYYSEDSGYSTFSNVQPKNLLVVDPIDGTRAAKSGFEACVISIATTRIIERPVMSDVDNGLVMEIVSGRYFYAERGSGARIYQGSASRKPKLSENLDLETVAWSMTVPGRPAELIFPTAARFIDLTSLKGGFFACNSTAYSLTRLLTNQLDACVDFAGRFYKDIPDLVTDNFLNAGRGHVLGVAPYDMVAALLIAQEAGCRVTDAYGRGFDDVMLLDSSAPNHQTIIAAASRELHEKLLSFFDTRVTQFENLLKRRAAKV
jgi:myo-inositol-1(or 4)-monophosphatase